MLDRELQRRRRSRSRPDARRAWLSALRSPPRPARRGPRRACRRAPAPPSARARSCDGSHAARSDACPTGAGRARRASGSGWGRMICEVDTAISWAVGARAGASRENRCPRRPRRAPRSRPDGCSSFNRDHAPSPSRQANLRVARSRRLGLRKRARVADERLVTTFARSTLLRPRSRPNRHKTARRTARGGPHMRRRTRPSPCRPTRSSRKSKAPASGCSRACSASSRMAPQLTVGEGTVFDSLPETFENPDANPVVHGSNVYLDYWDPTTRTTTTGKL